MPSIHAESSKQYKAPNSITQPQASAGSGNDEVGSDLSFLLVRLIMELI